MRKSGLRKGLGSTFVLAIALMLAGILQGSSFVGSFEIDGNLSDDSGPGEPIDWNSPPPNVTTFIDKTGSGDDIFSLGSKELDQDGWICETGSAPPKGDIVRGAISFRILAGKQFLYFSFFRQATTGDVHIDYEFNQLAATTASASPSCPTLPRRSLGDVVITFDTEEGGKNIQVRAFQWNGTGFIEFPLGVKGMFWDAAVNIPNTIPGAAAGAFGEGALNLTDTVGNIGCGDFNGIYMKTRASTSIDSALKDRTRPQSLAVVVPTPDLLKAKARGSAFAAHVGDTVTGVQLTVPNNVNPAGGVASSQSGKGSNSQSDAVLNIAIPGGALAAQVLSASSSSSVTAAPAGAADTSSAEVTDVNILGGLVTAKKVAAVAGTEATSTASTFSSLGSAFQDLSVQGVAQNNVNPNTTIGLPEALYGPGSFVKLYERIGSTGTPPPGDLTGGLFTADLTVNMIRIHITDYLPAVLGNQTVDVIVGSATSHAEFAQILICPPQTVSGHGFVLRETTQPAVAPVVVGFVDIQANGGFDHQNLDAVAAPTAGNGAGLPAGSVLTAGASVSESQGASFTDASAASTYAEVTGVPCIAKAGSCTVSAEVIRSQSNSQAGPLGTFSNADGTQLLGATVLGTDVCTMLGLESTCTPPANTRIDLAALGFVILNEQVCDNGGTLAKECADGSVAGHAGLTVRGIRLVVTVPNVLGLTPGAEIIVAEAHSDAKFVKH
jgi:hypothetical protein